MNDNGARQSPAATIDDAHSDGTTRIGALSTSGLVTADDLVGIYADELRRDAVLRNLAVSPGFIHHLGESAREVRRLRCRVQPGSSLAYLVGRLAGHVESLWLMVAPTAADFVGAGLNADEALEIVDRHVADLRAQMGGSP